jgi:hypothetical protein
MDMVWSLSGWVDMVAAHGLAARCKTKFVSGAE